MYNILDSVMLNHQIKSAHLQHANSMIYSIFLLFFFARRNIIWKKRNYNQAEDKTSSNQKAKEKLKT